MRQVLVAQLHSRAEQCSKIICDTKINLLWGPLAAYFVKVVIMIEMGRVHLFAGVTGAEHLARGSVSKK